jgi:cell division protein FtsB
MGVRPSKAMKRTGGKLGLSTSRAAVLAIVVCALALTLAVPLRTYLGQRQQLADTVAQREQLRSEVSQLERQRAQLNDPAYVESQARQRLRYVKPGQTPYQVQLPGGAPSDEPPPQAPAPVTGPWYSTLWASVNQPVGHG